MPSRLERVDQVGMEDDACSIKEVYRHNSDHRPRVCLCGAGDNHCHADVVAVSLVCAPALFPFDRGFMDSSGHVHHPLDGGTQASFLTMPAEDLTLLT